VTLYEGYNLLREGFRIYTNDKQNAYDWIYITLNYITVFYHFTHNPFKIEAKVTLVLSLILMIDRTYSLMSIFESFSPIVVMLNKVVWDLKVFLLFYAILISGFSIMASVIGYGNTQPWIN
jgi:hypothetical protein